MSLCFAYTSAQLSFSDAASTADDPFAEKRKLLEAANLLYYESWGEDLGTLLRPVPGYHNFNYLNKEKVNSLHLDAFYYPGTTLLVRAEYEAIYEELLAENISCDGVGGVVVTGQPGIGMCLSPTTSFLNVNQVPREVMLPVLSPVSPLKLEGDGCSSSR